MKLLLNSMAGGAGLGSEARDFCFLLIQLQKAPLAPTYALKIATVAKRRVLADQTTYRRRERIANLKIKSLIEYGDDIISETIRQ